MRPAPSDNEARAADLIAQRLTALGYDVEVQEFSIEVARARDASFKVTTPAARSVETTPLSGSGSGTLRGPIILAGLGRTSDFTPDVAGNIALVERGGGVTFHDKAANALAAGARGVVIYNNEPSVIFGDLNQDFDLPVVMISQEDGRALANDVTAGGVSVELVVADLQGGISRNVIARPPGKQCATVSGGHYDSVPTGAGANDNASGAATVLEIAAVVASKKEMGENCFVLFGAEERGLRGSQAFVKSLDTAGRKRIKAMLNFDMVGFGEDDVIQLIGSDALMTRAQDIGNQMNIHMLKTELRADTSSDHATFIGAGIASVMFYRGEDPQWHRAGDVVDGRLRPDYLQAVAALGVAMIESIAAG